jgi:hypothetical protein
MNDELLIIASEWSLELLTEYINKLEARVLVTNALIKELKVIQRKKKRRKIVDTGAPRGGK